MIDFRDITSNRAYLWGYLAALFGGGWLYVHLRLRQDAKAARAHVLARGVDVSQVRREVPVSRDRGRSWQMDEVKCTRYALPLRRNGRPCWTLLMRPNEEHPPMPRGWELTAPKDPVSPELLRVLQAIAAEWQDELLELEGEPEAVVAYWEESGGEQAAAKVCDYLEQLAKVM